MRRTSAALLILAVLGVTTVHSRGEEPYTEVLCAQVALDVLAISPGVIDGINGPRTAEAVALFQKVRGLAVSGTLDASTLTLLEAVGRDRLIRYRISEEDLTGLAPTPTDWIARSKMPSLPHENLLERLAERSHASRRLLCRLNPNVVWNDLSVGDTVTVPDVSAPDPPHADRLEISLSGKSVRAVSAVGKLMAFFHCSIAQDPDSRPIGEFTVSTVILDPPYAFDPKLWPESGVTTRLAIPPGPNNPVGVAWIGLSRPSFGLHGTPDPENVGVTGSHGCFRLTNWDVRRLASMVRKGTPVKVSP